MNSGVKLPRGGCEVLEDLQQFQAKGVEILSCGSCLDFYKLREKMSVGPISNMYDIIQSSLEADRLIRPSGG